MQKFRHPACVFLSGIALSQLFSIFLVSHSNTRMFNQLNQIERHGFLSAPNHQVMATLKNFASAFNGGLFFSLTVGVCLTLTAYAAAQTWTNSSKSRILTLMPWLIAWMGCIVIVNMDGFLPVVTLMFLTVPLAVFGMSLRWTATPARQHPYFSNLLWHVAPMSIFVLVLIVLVKTSPQPETIFLNIRDRLLLNNPVGQVVNRFYYTNSLYSADVFKSDDQRLLKTSAWKASDDPHKTRMIDNQLILFDYLPIKDGADADLQLALGKDKLRLMRNGRVHIEAAADEFLKNPSQYVHSFSDKTDWHRNFRGFTFLSILISGAVFLHLILFMPFRLIGSMIFKPFTANIFSCIAGLGFGIGALVLLAQNPIAGIKNDDVKKMLTSGNSHGRLNAIQYLVHHELDIANYIQQLDTNDGFNTAERYWLAKALGVSRAPDTAEMLFRLTLDPQFNVVCMAARSLGLRRDLPRKRVVERLVELVRTSNHWYVQWYAYRALKRLGWKQTVSMENR